MSIQTVVTIVVERMIVHIIVVVYPLPLPLLVGGFPSSRLWSTSQLLRPFAFAITKRRDMGLYEVHLSMSLWGLGMGIMLANFHMCGIMLVLRAVFNVLVRNASPRGPMCFGCLFSLSGPCELLYLFCFIASWTWLW